MVWFGRRALDSCRESQFRNCRPHSGRPQVLSFLVLTRGQLGGNCMQSMIFPNVQFL